MTLAEDFFQSIREMMAGYGQETRTKPSLATEEERSLRISLIEEELDEFKQALEEKDIVEVADAIGDLMVVVCGAAHTFGIPLPDVLEEIQRSNNSKIDPETGRVVRREDGKVLKPKSFSPPDLTFLLKDM